MTRKRPQHRPTQPTASRPESQPVRHAPLWLAAAFLLPNLGALACGFVLDDLPVIVENETLHLNSLNDAFRIWTSAYSPNPQSLGLYRPVSQTLWALVLLLFGARPLAFHALALALGLLVVLLAYRFLLAVSTPPRIAFIAALLFALFPIHTEVTTSAVGSAESLAAASALAALLLYSRPPQPDLPLSPTTPLPKIARTARRLALPSLTLYAFALLSKESAAAFAALPVIFAHKDKQGNASFAQRPLRAHALVTALGAATILAAALVARRAFAPGSLIPPIDNPTVLLDAPRRILTALWVQCLYLAKILFPITLSADYSYKQVSLVMGLRDVRAWAAIALAAAAALVALRSPLYRKPILAYAALFAPTANILFPIGTIMGERLAYAPSLAVALLLAFVLARSSHWKIILLAVALAFAARCAVRNLDWLTPDRFYTRLLETAPASAKAAFFYGTLRAARGDDPGAIQAYDRAIAIFPAYSEAYHNRANALVRLGRRPEAIADYRNCLRFDPGHAGAAHNLNQLLAGLPLYPPRKKL